MAMQKLTDSATGFQTQPFLYNPVYIYWHQYTIIVGQLYITLILAMGAVCAFCLFFLGSLGNTMAVMLSLVLVDVDLVGILHVCLEVIDDLLPLLRLPLTLCDGPTLLYILMIC